MKKIFYICAVALAAFATSCSSEKDIDLDTNGGAGLEFVHFESASDAWMVTKDDTSYAFDVVVAATQKQDTDVTYEISLGDKTTGVEGTDFSIPTKSVTIKAGEYTGKFTVNVLYATTGEGFEIELLLKVDEKLVNPAYGASAFITVKSDKVTIDWKWLESKWNCQDYSYYSGANDGDPYTVAIKKVTETTGILSGLWGGGDLTFTVDFDALTLTFAVQPGFEAYGAVCYIIAVDPSADFEPYTDINTPIVATMSPAGIVIDNYDFLLVGGQYDGYTYAGGAKSTLTK